MTAQPVGYRRLPIRQAATRLGTTARMLRYRESLGLAAPPRGGGGHREYGDRELRTAAYAADLEARYEVSPKALAFALRVLADGAVQADVRRLGELAGRLEPSVIAALDFDQEKAQRLLGERR
ncbi:MAG: MerR family transcriptional regulator [Actinomycetota bacterium]|nr:MerR family transcriptional regulator [Actinomycetota bacterium]